MKNIYPGNVRKMSQIIIIQILDIPLSRKCSKTCPFPDVFWIRNSWQFPDIFWTQFCPEFLLKKFKWLCHHLYNVTNFKLYIIDSIFARSSSLLNISRKVLNVSFALFTFFYKINLSIFRNIVRNFFMSGKCSVWFVWDASRIFSCPEYVWFTCTNSGHEKILNIIFDHFLGHFPDIFKYIRTDSGNFDDVFLTFLFIGTER